MNTTATITADQLVADLIAAKAAETQANNLRIKLETQLIELLGAKAEGAQTHQVGNFKVTITGKQSYKADLSMLLDLCESLPANLRPVKTETKLDETGAKYLRNNEPELWRVIAPAITVKPAKTAVEIKA